MFIIYLKKRNWKRWMELVEGRALGGRKKEEEIYGKGIGMRNEG